MIKDDVTCNSVQRTLSIWPHTFHFNVDTNRFLLCTSRTIFMPSCVMWKANEMSLIYPNAVRLLSHTQSSGTVYEFPHYLAAVYHGRVWYWKIQRRKVSGSQRRISALWHVDTTLNLWECSDASWIWTKKDSRMEQRARKVGRNLMINRSAI